MRVDRIGIVVPAHNEEQLVGACIRALAAAADWPRDRSSPMPKPMPVHIVAVLDSCTDSTGAAIWAAAGQVPQLPFARLDVITAEVRSVGSARRAGVRFLLDRLPTRGTWLASTDADSRVPPDWLRAQLEHRAAGTDAVVGTVVVDDWACQPPALPRLYLDRYHAVDGHRHVHGANLSMTADCYLAVGGFPARVTDEDVGLVDALVVAGFRVTWAADLPVTTSARSLGRAPDGFAAYLGDLGDPQRLARRDARTRSLVPSVVDRSGAETVSQ